MVCPFESTVMGYTARTFVEYRLPTTIATVTTTPVTTVRPPVLIPWASPAGIRLEIRRPNPTAYETMHRNVSTPTSRTPRTRGGRSEGSWPIGTLSTTTDFSPTWTVTAGLEVMASRGLPSGRISVMPSATGVGSGWAGS